MEDVEGQDRKKGCSQGIPIRGAETNLPLYSFVKNKDVHQWYANATLIIQQS